MSEECTHLFKIIIIGDSGVGKSSVLLRYAEDTYAKEFLSTIGVDFRVKSLKINEKAIKLQIWDTAGQERFRTLTSAYYRGAQGIIIAYDVTNRSSFTHLKEWVAEIERNAPENVKRILISTKNDLKEREVTSEEGSEFAAKFHMNFIETSAKDSHQVETAFLTLSLLILSTFPSSNHFSLQNSSSKNSSKNNFKISSSVKSFSRKFPFSSSCSR